MVGDDRDALFRIAPIVDEDAGEHAAGLALADADCEVLIELGESPGLQNVGEHVGGDLGVPALQTAHAIRRDIGGDEGDHQPTTTIVHRGTAGTAGNGACRRRS